MFCLCLCCSRSLLRHECVGSNSVDSDYTNQVYCSDEAIPMIHLPLLAFGSGLQRGPQLKPAECGHHIYPFIQNTLHAGLQYERSGPDWIHPPKKVYFHCGRVNHFRPQPLVLVSVLLFVSSGACITPLPRYLTDLC